MPSVLWGTVPDALVRVFLVRDLKKGWGRRRSSSVSIGRLRRTDSGLDIWEAATSRAPRSLTPNWNAFFQAPLKVGRSSQGTGVTRRRDLKEKDMKTAVLKMALYTVERGEECLKAETHKSLAKLELTQAQSHYTAKLVEFTPVRTRVEEAEGAGNLGNGGLAGRGRCDAEPDVPAHSRAPLRQGGQGRPPPPPPRRRHPAQFPPPLPGPSQGSKPPPCRCLRQSRPPQPGQDRGEGEDGRRGRLPQPRVPLPSLSSQTKGLEQKT